jgi:hypothetical protein
MLRNTGLVYPQKRTVQRVVWVRLLITAGEAGRVSVF